MKIIYRGKDVTDFSKYLFEVDNIEDFTRLENYEVYIADGNLVIEDRG